MRDGETSLINSVVSNRKGGLLTDESELLGGSEERQNCHEMVAWPAIQAQVRVSRLQRAVVQIPPCIAVSRCTSLRHGFRDTLCGRALVALGESPDL
jgi:hypothetical protein